MHGFVLLKSEGRVIALGDQINIVRGREAVSRLVFHFRDGSLDDETTTFRQGTVFQLLTDHHIQKGPSFPKPMDTSVDARTGTVTSREERDGKEEIKTEHVDLPSDLSNGLISSILESIPKGAEEVKVSYLASDPKPRVVKLSVRADGTDTFRAGRERRRALRYKVHVELGGIGGVVAPLIGKQPSDFEIWVEDGPVPAFIKLRGALYVKGPIWTMELTSPAWAD